MKYLILFLLFCPSIAFAQSDTVYSATLTSTNIRGKLQVVLEKISPEGRLRLSILPQGGYLARVVRNGKRWGPFDLERSIELTPTMFYHSQYLDTLSFSRDSLSTVEQLSQYQGLSGYECIFFWRKVSLIPLQYRTGNYGINVISSRDNEGDVTFEYSTSTKRLIELTMDDDIRIFSITFYLDRPYRRKQSLTFSAAPSPE